VVRIAGIDLPKTKRIEYALTKIYGIGLSSSQNILKKANVDLNTRTNELSDENIISIREILQSKHLVESELKRKINLNIKRLSEINCYRGKRHREQLPLRGQRTRTNARTRRGSKKTVAGKKK
jgi:small subunit ribosomal protein S13|tara:strand:- start:6968 stop:7336 length:369 start_codon:yes stop_codon:yes gene_type:complete